MSTVQYKTTAIEMQHSLFSLWQETIGDIWPIDREKFNSTLFHEASLNRSIIFSAHAGDKLVGFISVKWKSQGQIQCLLVHPAYQRQGIGTELLEQGLDHLRSIGMKQVQLGAGAYAYFWPGVPQNLPPAVAFFRTSGWNYTEEMVDMIADLSGHKIPTQAMERIKATGVRVQAAVPEKAAQILDFEKEHFPEWYGFFRHRIEIEDYTSILIAQRSGEILGSVIVTKDDNKWNLITGDRVGSLGALGVKESARGNGVGLALAAKATQMHKDAGMNYATADYTYLVGWYGRLGYVVWRQYQMSWKGV